MSEAIRLSAQLAGDEDTNGVDPIAAALVDAPETLRVAVVWFDVAKVTKDVDSGDEIPTIRLRRVEPITDDADLIAVKKAAEAAFTERTGRPMLPIPDLDE